MEGEKIRSNRRNVLKALSAGITVTGISSVSGGAKVKPSKIEIRRSQKNPIPLKAVLKKRQAYIKRWTKNNNHKKLKSFVTLSSPRFSPKTSIFSYDFELLEDGTPVEYFGTVTENPAENTTVEKESTAQENPRGEKIIEKLHERSSKRFAENRSFVARTSGGSDSIGTMSSPTNWSDWTSRNSTGNTDVVKPYGTWEWSLDH